ncbi:leukocyte surface antigen CD53-like [Varroa destructor]|uniref:Tetraspanin n=1 Tax=Varroa destructor TaxID=109461 RepID=A0A7M7K069_VARDE|nr:leukocyte surface antigen CD53-like [Varroa destructor]
MLARCSKFMLVAFNITFVLLSIGIATVGGLGLYFMQKSGYAIGDNYVSIPILLIFIGSTVCTLAFIGCVGALCESVGLLITYALLTFLVLVGEAVVVILAITHRSQTESIVGETLNKTLVDYWKNSKINSAKAAWDFVQTKLECCGVYGRHDWKAQGLLPPSCQNFTTGCLPAIEKKLNEFIPHIIVFASLFCAVEVATICASCALALIPKSN